MIQSFRDLVVWQKAMVLTVDWYRTMHLFPKREIYGLTSQIRRSATSIPSNIAEGHARGTTKEFLHFISISSGSLAELETQLELARRLEHMTSAEYQTLALQAQEVGRMLNGLMSSLRNKINDPLS